ncbi:MAG: hypothetical protein KatS3mg105_4345 [Gemmatales bacterium]|nr:MAG: hypothetical protein KatS3mg105_4345 [Gemmatales bacterium]
MSRCSRLVMAGVFGFLLGCLVAPQLPLVLAQETPKAPKFSHGLTLGVRKSDEPDFTKDTKKYGVEVFVDQNNGNLIYISETGSIAVVKGK